jgi:hypothetical protein
VIRVAFVTGSRAFRSTGSVWEWLDWQAQAAIAQRADMLVVMHGACPSGADHYAHTWVVQRSSSWTRHGLKVHEQADPALWAGLLGKHAGPARNSRQARRLQDYREHGGVDIHIAVAHYAVDLDACMASHGGTADQAKRLVQAGFGRDEMTYLEET